MGTFALTQLMSSRVKAFVICAGGVATRAGDIATRAGGIATCAGIDAAMMLGADAAQLGTAFLACEESGASHEHRKLPPFPIQSWFVSHLKQAAMAAKRTDLVSLWWGQIAPNLKFRTVTQLMQSLTEVPFR